MSKDRNAGTWKAGSIEAVAGRRRVRQESSNRITVFYPGESRGTTIEAFVMKAEE